MENYSPAMQADLCKQLRKTDINSLGAMLSYFEKRGGPGLELVRAELAIRQAPTSANRRF